MGFCLGDCESPAVKFSLSGAYKYCSALQTNNQQTKKLQ